MLDDPESAVINAEEIKKLDPTNMARSLLRSMKMQTVLEEALQTVCGRLDETTPTAKVRDQAEEERDELQKQLTALTKRIDNAGSAMKKVYDYATLTSLTIRKLPVCVRI